MKTKPYIFALTIAIFTILGNFSCGMDSPSTPPVPTFGDVELDIVSYSQSTPALIRNLDLEGGEIILNEALIALDEIDLKAVDESGSEVDLDGPFVARLVNDESIVNETYPDIGLVSVPAGNYDRIRFKIHVIESNETPDGFESLGGASSFLVGNSIVLTGRFQEAASGDLNGNGVQDYVDFRFISDNGVDIQIDSSAGFAIDASRTNYVFIAFDLDGWMNGTLASLQTLSNSDLSDGTVVLTDDASENLRGIAELIEDNILVSSRIAESEDEEFDDDEDVDEESSSEEDVENSEAQDNDEEDSTEEDASTED